MRKFYLLFIAVLFFSVAKAQISIPATTVVTENFNSIGSSSNASLPINWKMSSAGTGTTSNWTTGTNITATTQAANNGTPVTGGAYNWATATGTDRAVGFMTDGSYNSTNSIMAHYRNTTGTTVTSLTITFAVERYRINTSPFTLSFFSSNDGNVWIARGAGDVSAATFTTAASAYSFGAAQTVFKTVTITGLSIANNGDFYLRWLFATGNSNSQGIGLDNISVYAGAATPALTAKLRDELTIDGGVINQANPGDQLTYTTTIKNTGTADANNVNITVPAPANTTLVPGSVRTSALARDDIYSTPFNTVLNGTTVSANDYGLPSVSLVSFGQTANPSTIVNGTNNAATDNGGSVVLNTDGTFTYSPPAGFIGYDRFAYIAGTGTLPNNDAIVVIAVGSTPTAGNDSYNIVGNVSIAPNTAAGVLNNDAGTGITIIAVNGNSANVGAAITTSGGGNLTVNANGSFTYNPPAGFEGTDNFTYTIDNGFSAPVTATVTLNISGMVWFITNGGAAGDGRLSSPFNSIAAFQAVNNGTGNNPAANDYIFVFENAAAYTGSLTLLNGQRLIGQDATAALSAITGLTPNATYSTQFPVMNTGAPATTLTTTVAATNAVNLGSGNTLRGFTLGNTTGTGISGSSFGTLTISEVSKNGTGQALALTTGAFGSPAIIDNITTTSSVNAVSLTGCTGTLTISAGAISGATGASFSISGGTCSVTYSGGITQANNAAMVSVSGGHATGTVTFQTGTLSATNGTGLQFDNADGIYNFNGATTLNGGDAGIDIFNGSAGNFSFGAGTSITSPSGAAFSLGGGTTSTCNITYSGTITQAINAAMVSITGGHTTGTITFQTGTLSATNGSGIDFSNAAGIYNFNGTTTLNASLARVLISSSSGSFLFSANTSITNPSGAAAAFAVTGGSASVTYNGNISQSSNALVSVNTHITGTLLFQTGTLTATGGTGLQFNDADGTYTFNGLVTLNGGDAGIDIITASSGNFTFANCPITNPSGAAIIVNGGNCVMTHTGAISKTSAGRLIDIQFKTGGSVTVNSSISSTVSSTGINVSGCTGGTITFAGSTKTLNTPGSNPVNLATNTGTAISFTNGGLAITSTTATGFNATGGGTVTVQGAANTIVSTTGTALNVVSTTIGASGLTFQSISANGAATGILLDNTGASAGLTITGTGSTGTGGVIQNCVQRGARFLSCSNISLSWMTFTNNGTANIDPAATAGDCLNGLNTNAAAGIDLQTVSTVSINNTTITGGAQIGLNGKGVSNFTMSNSSIQNAGNEVLEDGFQLSNLSGTCSITNCSFTGNFHRQFEVQNSTGTLNLTVTGSTFDRLTYVSTSAQGVLIAGRLTAVITASVKSSLFQNNFGSGFFGQSIDNSNVALTVGSNGTSNIPAEGNTFTNNSLAFQIVSDNASTMNFNIGNNTHTVTATVTSGATPFSVRKGTNATGSVTGNIGYNTLGSAAAQSGNNCAGCNGLTITDEGLSGGMNVTVRNNLIQHVNQRGIEAIMQLNDAMNVTVINNTIQSPDGTIGQAIFGQSGNDATDNGTLCMDIQGNVIGGNWDTGVGVTRNIRLRQAPAGGTSVFRLRNLVGSTPADVINHLNATNTNAQASATATGSFTGGTAACN